MRSNGTLFRFFAQRRGNSTIFRTENTHTATGRGKAEPDVNPYHHVIYFIITLGKCQRRKLLIRQYVKPLWGVSAPESP